jgi:hypothetical protein
MSDAGQIQRRFSLGRMCYHVPRTVGLLSKNDQPCLWLAPVTTTVLPCYPDAIWTLVMHQRSPVPPRSPIPPACQLDIPAKPKGAVTFAAFAPICYLFFPGPSSLSSPCQKPSFLAKVPSEPSLSFSSGLSDSHLEAIHSLTLPDSIFIQLFHLKLSLEAIEKKRDHHTRSACAFLPNSSRTSTFEVPTRDYLEPFPPSTSLICPL